MLLIAHRGASGEAPENTFAAFILALAHQADGVEADVRLSSDGVPILIHDPRLDRTAGQPGQVADKDYSDLAPLDVGSWKDAKFAAERMPRLDEVVRWSADNQVLLRLDCKAVERDVASLVRQVTSILWAVGDGLAPAEVMSSSPKALAAAKQTHPGVRTGLVVTNRMADPLSSAKAARSDWMHMHWPRVTAEIVD
ncbi:MAG: glycerophosphodiester phosphodiesterase family protein [Chloroflexi bacterium]|nr:glycerophosphodiester phosphodiesterase family protein [Chloroflexota bacterium]